MPRGRSGPIRYSHWLKWLAGTGALLVAAVLFLALVPLGLLKGIAENRLSARFDAPVTIARLERLDPFSLHPRIRIAGMRVGQPAWAGAGDFAKVDEAVVRIPVLPILHGAFRPESIDVRGLTLNLVRDATGRSNWGGGGKGGKPTRIDHLTITASRLTLRDAKRRMTLDAALTADSAHGVSVVGPGTHRGLPMRFAAHGGAIDGASADRPWPLTLSLASPLLVMTVRARTDAPLDINRLDAVLTARGPDIAYLDDVIEAGLPGTQAFNLTATVRRDRPDWHVKALAGTIGRSDLRGAVWIRKRDGRTILDGRLDAGRLDFDDLASDAGQARAAAKRAATGPRVIPDTQIHLERLGKLDGVLRVSAAQLLLPGPSLFQGFRGTLTLDHRLLTVSPLSIRLTHGVLAGRLRVDHRGAAPHVTIDLRQSGTRLADLTGNAADIDGPVEARILLNGAGRDLRTAIAGANGRIALVMHGGSMRRKLAIFASGDVLKSLGQLIGGSDTARVPVNCLIGNFAVRGGALIPTALLLDSPVGRADGTGRASLADEHLALLFAGRSKHPDPIQIAAKVRVAGSFSSPVVALTDAQGLQPTKHGLFGKIGDLLGSLRTKGDAGRGLPIPPANCAALSTAALR